MDSFQLTAMSPLGGYEQTFADTKVTEIPELAIVSISVPRDGLGAVNEALDSRWHVTFPDIGQCRHISSIKLTDTVCTGNLVGLQADQCFMVVDPGKNSTHSIVEHICSALDSSAYLSDQSDSWAVLDITGPLALKALERICMLDLVSMKSESAARTTMDHLSVIIEKNRHHSFKLYSPRSSAISFLHTVTTSLHNVMEM
ncbi:MAG: hypothetical protein AB8B87_10115 [Granulosicoccus sp.]